jgi:two-component system, OmpR family, phosphate regulon sensor histidine kinase PhoR
LSSGKKSLGASTSLMPGDAGCLVILRDISEIQKSRTTRRDFITNISHELRTPVTSIKVLAETLGGGAFEDKTKAAEYLKKIEMEADRLAHLISEMSEMLKIEGGYSPVKKSGIAPVELLKEAAERLGPQAAHAGLSLSVDIPVELPQLNADREKLEHVLINLVQNAVKFTPSGGSIILSARPVPGAVQFSVSDTGIGIPKEDLSRVFERFYKVDRARSGGGTGLGLAIARQIVEAHGGRIWTESTEGKGSTFIFTIPL